MSARFTPGDRELLLELLRIPTVNPLEPGGEGCELIRAQRRYAAAAAELGMQVVHHAAPPPGALLREDAPSAVREAASADDAFRREQPSLVLRLGPPLPRERTVMFNVHLDTVAGLEPVGFDGAVFTGRGAIDAKGPAVALLAGIRAAAPALGREVGVLVQAVAGEEGGAMGSYGTRPLVEAGHVGRLNVFCEPTGLRALTRCTASATAEIAVAGHGSIDDRPDAGHNATALLGFLAQHLARELDPAGRPGRMCLAGLHTGQRHNRVYGEGRLLINLSYATSEEGAEAERALADSVRSGLKEFAETFGGTREFARTAADAAEITELRWTKRGLPALRGADGIPLLDRAGIARWPAAEPPFTCDAIWLDGVPGAEAVVLGPGSLEGNHAHAAGEHAELADLEGFAAAVAALLTEFAEEHRPSGAGKGE